MEEKKEESLKLVNVEKEIDEFNLPKLVLSGYVPSYIDESGEFKVLCLKLTESVKKENDQVILNFDIETESEKVYIYDNASNRLPVDIIKGYELYLNSWDESINDSVILIDKGDLNHFWYILRGFEQQLGVIFPDNWLEIEKNLYFLQCNKYSNGTYELIL